MLKRLLLGFRQIANLKVDRIGFQTASVPLEIGEPLDPRGLTLREPEPAFAGAFCSCHQYTPSQINLGKCGLCGKPPRS